MSRIPRSAAARAVPIGLAMVLSLAACSSRDNTSGGTDSASPTSAGGDATTIPDTASPGTTTAPTAAPTTTLAAVPWRDDAAAAVAEVLGAAAGKGNVSDIARRWFGLPVVVAVPGDAALSVALVRATASDAGTVDARWEVHFASASATAADMEAAVVSGFSDPRFVPGVRVVSQLDVGDFVTLNYSVSDVGSAEGWTSFSVSVGPETDIDGPTGRQRVAVSVERSVASLADLGLPGLLTSWVAQFPPLADGVRFSELEADLTNLSTQGIWITSRATAPTDRYPALVEYYSKDWSSGDLEYGQSATPADLSGSDYFTAGSFPKLAGYTVSVITTRSLSNPDEPARVEYRVRLENPAG